MKKNKVCAVVDAYSAGSLIAPELIKRGLTVIHIHSNKTDHVRFLGRFNPRDFIEDIVFDGNLEKLTAKLKTYNLLFLIPGFEGGVKFADVLRDRLKLFPNDISLSGARRNKYKMIERIKECSLNGAKQFLSDNISDVLKWIKTNTNYPVVLKPVESGGTENVNICHNEPEVRSAFQSTIGRKNILGILNDKVLVQSYLDGEEYIVNTVSWEGKHVLGDMWHMKKTEVRGAGRVYDLARLIEPNGKIYKSLKDYVFNVLDALKVTYGPEHSEVMLTADGPALIETGSRIDGHGVYENKKAVRCLDSDQIELTAEAFISPELFLKRIDKPNSLLKYAALISLISPAEGKLKDFGRMKEIENLPSYWEAHIYIKPGDKLERTVDMFTCPGTIWMAHDDKNILQNDYYKIREIEKNGLYILE